MSTEQILILSPNWLGDAVMAMPAVKRFRRENPTARVTMLAKPVAAPLWRLHESLDEVLV